MDTQAYPGEGLSLSQLVFALNEELKRAAYSPSYVAKDHRRLVREASRERYADFLCSFTVDKVSQLDQDTSTALATIREWRNSFVHINRIPLDILSLIPTHLSSQKDRFRASFLYLSKGEVYTKTLLERARGSALDITTNCMDHVGAIALLPPHTRQIRYLDFAYGRWADIRRFSEVNHGPLPLLRTLRIKGIGPDDPDAMTLPSLPLFSSAVNLKEFLLRLEGSPFFGYFGFPNLTTFELSAMPLAGFHTSQLLDFLEASPMLRTVDMKIITDVLLEDVPRERIAVLPNVKTFNLVMSDGGSGYEFAAHISCPSARHTSFMHEKDTDDVTPPEIFPSSVSWNAIVRQYTRSPAEEVTLILTITPNPVITCSITFRSPDATATRLGYKVTSSYEDDDELSEEMHHEVFSQASRTIRGHPRLVNIKRLRIYHSPLISTSNHRTLIASEVGRLFKSVGPLEELTIHGCDLQSCLTTLAVFPPIKELTISHPLLLSQEGCMAVIVEFVKSRHVLGIPFERVTVRMEKLPTAMAERLGPWVGAADCYDELYMEGYSAWCPL